jgi:hypothetical protein
MALFVVITTPLAALAITFFVTCHPCCCHHYPCCDRHLLATLIAITIALAALAIALFVAHHNVAVAIPHVIAV